MEALYDQIGKGYRAYRKPDSRIGAAILNEIGDGETILNVGAGVGSYEPLSKRVIALEPSRIMLRQRSSTSAPAVQGVAEALPFSPSSFDVATAFLTLHHWTDWREGLTEMRRVARRRVVILTWQGFGNYWLLDYFPQMREADEPLFPSMEEMRSVLGPFRLVTVPIPGDCTDGFMCAYWKRPRAYLDPGVRRAISTFARINDVEEGLARLQRDLDEGAWQEKYGSLLEQFELDLGYRLMVVDAP